MKRRFSLFTYPVMDMKAAEAELNRRAASGWRLERVWLGTLASFVPAESPVTYCLDWYDPNREDGPDYSGLLARAGWQFRSQAKYWNIYEAPAGTTPIQTDGELEYQRFRKKALRSMKRGGGTLLALAAVLAALLMIEQQMDLGAGVLRADPGPVTLTGNELRILQALLERRGKVVRREDLMTALWATDCYIDENTLTVNVARLRKRLEAAGVPGLIRTVKGEGYCIP